MHHEDLHLLLLAFENDLRFSPVAPSHPVQAQIPGEETWPVVYSLCASGPHTSAPPLRCPRILPPGSPETACGRCSAVSWASADSQQAIPLTWPDRDPGQVLSAACSSCKQEAAPNSGLCSPFVLS